MNEPLKPDSPESELPQEVVAAMKERHGPSIPIPDSVDRAILDDAAVWLGQRNVRSLHGRKGSRFRWAAWSSGTIAAAMLLFAVLPNMFQPAEPRFERSTASSEMVAPMVVPPEQGQDIDGNGTINILDAFALARNMTGDGDGRWDQNGDGITDQDDIDLIAMTAVTL